MSEEKRAMCVCGRDCNHNEWYTSPVFIKKALLVFSFLLVFCLGAAWGRVNGVMEGYHGGSDYKMMRYYGDDFRGGPGMMKNWNKDVQYQYGTPTAPSNTNLQNPPPPATR